METCQQTEPTAHIAALAVELTRTADARATARTLARRLAELLEAAEVRVWCRSDGALRCAACFRLGSFEASAVGEVLESERYSAAARALGSGPVVFGGPDDQCAAEAARVAGEDRAIATVAGGSPVVGAGLRVPLLVVEETVGLVDVRDERPRDWRGALDLVTAAGQTAAAMFRAAAAVAEVEARDGSRPTAVGRPEARATGGVEATAATMSAKPASTSRPQAMSVAGAPASCAREPQEKTAVVAARHQVVAAGPSDGGRTAGEAMIDGLTGLATHRCFHERLTEESVLAEARTAPLALLFVDVDGFKAFNDGFGHRAGDSALRTIARAILASIRRSDVAARYGGQEFAVLLPGADVEGAVEIAERMRTQVRRLVDEGGSPAPLTISVGVAVAPTHARDKDDLVERAGLAMYAAKRCGKDRVFVFGKAEPL